VQSWQIWLALRAWGLRPSTPRLAGARVLAVSEASRGLRPHTPGPSADADASATLGGGERGVRQTGTPGLFGGGERFRGNLGKGCLAGLTPRAFGGGRRLGGNLAVDTVGHAPSRHNVLAGQSTLMGGYSLRDRTPRHQVSCGYQLWPAAAHIAN
jgi:hypothetical protein